MVRTNCKDGDLNKDGIVDEKDIRFVEKNFLKKVDASKSQTPVEKSKAVHWQIF